MAAAEAAAAAAEVRSAGMRCVLPYPPFHGTHERPHGRAATEPQTPALVIPLPRAITALPRPRHRG